MADYAEQFCESIDIIFKERIKSVKFDTTIVCSIVSAEKAQWGEYTVSDGSVNFLAYSLLEQKYHEGDNVLVTIPNGDYDQQKIIIGKQVSSTDTPFKYVDPLTTIVDITSNMISGDLGEHALYANGYINEKLIWEADLTHRPVIGYDRIGLAAEFSSWLSTYQPKSGTYGLRLEVTFDSEWIAGEEQLSVYHQQAKEMRDLADENKETFRIAYENHEITEAQYNQKIEEIESTLQEQLAELGLQESDIRNELMSNVKNVYLDSHEDFYGNIYAFDSYYFQSAVFDISSYKTRKIIGLKLYFYQKQDFKTLSDNYIPAPDFDSVELEEAISAGTVKSLTQYYSTYTDEQIQAIMEPDDFISMHENLFMKDPYICFGYLLEGFSEDKAVLYSASTLTYSTLKPDEENKKIIELRWVHVEDESDIKAMTIDDLPEQYYNGYKINWYRYSLGARSPDTYAGMFWELLASYPVPNTDYTALKATLRTQPETNWDLSQTIVMDTTLFQEQFKAIIVKNNAMIATSNILTFSNEQDVENETQTDLGTALGIVCGYPDSGCENGFYQDGEQGSFFLYKKGNEIQDEGKAKEVFSLTPTFKSVRDKDDTRDLILLTEASFLVWSFPAHNTMLRPVLGQDTFITENMIKASQTAANKIDDTMNQLFANQVYNRFYIINEGKYKVIYNRSLDTIEFVHLPDPEPQLHFGMNSNDSIIQHYYIERVFSPAKVNNTVECEIIKDRLRYHASRQFYFGQAGTSGSDYTVVLDFKNNVNVLSIANKNDYSGSTMIAAEEYIGSAEDNFYYAMIVSARLLDQNGQEVDLNTIGTGNDAAYFTFDFPRSEISIAGHIIKHVPLEDSPGDIFYPVNFGSIQKLDFSYGTYESYHTAQYYIDETSNSHIWDVGAKQLYHYYDSINHEFRPLEDYPGMNSNSISVYNFLIEHPYDQLYRKLQLSDTNFNDEAKNKIVYEAVKDMSELIWQTAFSTGRLRFFIQDNNNFILDWGEAYNEAQNYFYAIEADATQDGVIVLEADYQGPDGNELPKNSRWIRISDAVRGTVDTSTLMDSLSILRVTLENFGNYPLTIQYPIPLRRFDTQHYCYSLIGENYIRYYSDGSAPDYYKNPYAIRYIDDLSTGKTDFITDTGDTLYSHFSLIIPTVAMSSTDEWLKYVPKFTNNILQPLSIYIPNSPLFGIQYFYNGKVYWNQPILVYQDNYPSATLNKWDGKTITTDDETGSIIANAVAAGKKERDNSFSGVMMGDWSRTDIETSGSFKQTGLYGFHHGSMSFAFKEDGTAFIGKDGSGRLFFAGDKALIYSSSWLVNKTGMLLNFNTGDIKMAQKNDYDRFKFNHTVEYNNYIESELEKIRIDEQNDWDPTDMGEDPISGGWSHPAWPNITGDRKTSVNLYEFRDYVTLTNDDVNTILSSNQPLYCPCNFSNVSVFYHDDDIKITSDFFFYLIKDTTKDAPVVTKLKLVSQLTPEEQENYQNSYTKNWALTNVQGKGWGFGYTEVETQYYTKKEIRTILDEHGNPVKVEKRDPETGEVIVDEHGNAVMIDKTVEEEWLYRKVTTIIKVFQRPANDTTTFGDLKQAFQNSGNTDLRAYNLYYADDWIKFQKSESNYTSDEIQIQEMTPALIRQYYNYFYKRVSGSNINEVYKNVKYPVNGSTGTIAAFNPFKRYYRRSGVNTNRYATLSSNETVYPLSIGSEENVASRNFKVLWDGSAFLNNGYLKGDINASGGYISGNMTVSGILRGGIFYTSELYADWGTIGGWEISSAYLKSPDSITYLWANAPENSANIETNFIQINSANNTVTGKIGYIQGHDANNNPTDAIGITSTHKLIFESSSDIRLSSFGAGIHLEAGGVKMRLNAESRGNVSLEAGSGSVTITAGSITFNTPSPEDQHGIYARFG